MKFEKFKVKILVAEIVQKIQKIDNESWEWDRGDKDIIKIVREVLEKYDIK